MVPLNYLLVYIKTLKAKCFHFKRYQEKILAF